MSTVKPKLHKHLVWYSVCATNIYLNQITLKGDGDLCMPHPPGCFPVKWNARDHCFGAGYNFWLFTSHHRASLFSRFTTISVSATNDQQCVSCCVVNLNTGEASDGIKSFCLSSPLRATQPGVFDVPLVYLNCRKAFWGIWNNLFLSLIFFCSTWLSNVFIKKKKRQQ